MASTRALLVHVNEASGEQILCLGGRESAAPVEGQRPYRRLAGLLGVTVTAAALALGTTAPTWATPRIVLPPALQQAAVLCLGEALRVCPDALKAKDHGIGCIRTKRHLLSIPCRTVYDQGVSFLHGGDVHLDLRALQRKLLPAPGG